MRWSLLQQSRGDAFGDLAIVAVVSGVVGQGLPALLIFEVMAQLAGGALILFAAAGNNLGWGEKKPRECGVSIKTAN